MEKKSFFKRYGAYLVAIVVFAAISCIYCAPSLEGKIVSAGDTNSFKGMVHESTTYHEQTGDYTSWTGSMFCGMPNYQIGGTHYASSTLLKPFKKLLLAGHSQTKTPAILFIYFLCFFIMLRAFDVDKWLSLAGALAIGFSTYFLLIIPAGHITKTSTIALMAVVVGGFKLIYKKKYGLGVILTALPTAVSFVNHPQMAYYICMLIGVLFFAELYIHLREKRMKDFGLATLLFAASLAVGLGANCANVFANQEYAEQTMRGGHSDLEKSDDATNKTKGLDLDYATQWSYGIDETLSFMIPGIMGGASSYDVGKESNLYKTLVRQGIDSRSASQIVANAPLYWGDQPFTAGNVYMGAIVCFLFVLGLLLVKGPYKWAIAVATLFSVALAWGYHFMPLTAFFFKWFPLYNKFRTVSSILIVAEITMPLLGFMAVKELFAGTVDRKKAFRAICLSAGITGGICLLLALCGPSLFSFTSAGDAQLAQYYPDWMMKAIEGERRALLVSDSWRSLLFIVASAAVLAFFTRTNLKKGWVVAALAVLVVADLWPVNKRYFNDDNFVTAKQNDAQFAMLPYEKQILADPDPHFRVFNLTTNTFNEARTSYYLKSIGGYSAAKLRRYQDIIDQHIAKMNLNVINMLNTKYIIMKSKDGQAQAMPNPDAMGNAWFVDTLMVVNNANEESAALNTIDLHTTAVLDKEFASFASNPTPGRADDAEIHLTKYTPKYIDYESHSSAPGTAVFSEVYYPYGWKVTVDGQPADHFRVNYILRALNLPAGDHKIHFEFSPDSVRKGDTISVICICLMYAFLLGYIACAVARCLKRRKQAVNA